MPKSHEAKPRNRHRHRKTAKRTLVVSNRTALRRRLRQRAIAGHVLSEALRQVLVDRGIPFRKWGSLDAATRQTIGIHVAARVKAWQARAQEHFANAQSTA